MGEYWKERTTFSEYVTEPFEVKNKYFFENILKAYLINTDVTEKKKMFDWFKKKRQKMKKKTLFDIAMEEKNRKQMEDENVVVTKKNSKISVAIEIIGKILNLIKF